MSLFIHQVHIVREKITWPGARIKKKEEGMPNYENNHEKGDLFITFDVEFPRGGMSESEKEGRFYFYHENWLTKKLKQEYIGVSFYLLLK